MIRRSRSAFLTPWVIAACLATSGARTGFAQEAPSVVIQQMQDQMRLMEQRLQKAEQRAGRAEAMVSDMQNEMRTHNLRAQEQMKKPTPAADEAQGEIATGTSKDFKGSVPVLEDKPLAALDLNYFYGRVGLGTNFRGGQRETNDGRNTAFVNPLVSDNNAGRLGNELDMYLEPSLKIITRPLRDSPASFGGVFTLSSYTPQRTQIDLATDIRVLDFYGFAKNAISFFPDAEVWAGRRGYLNQFYINIIDRRQMVIGGDGAGVNNIAFGNFGKLDLAYLSASPFGGSNSSVNPLNPLGSTYGEIRTDNGNLNKQAAYIRFHDLELPNKWGQLSFQAQYVHVEGGRALLSGDFQGVPGSSAYNNLNFNGIILPPSDGLSVGMVHDYKLEFGPNKENNLSNHIYLGAGWGNEYDTTNANKLRASPYYFVSIDVLLANGNTVFTLADAYAYKFADQFNLALGKSFALDAFVAYEHQNSGRPNVPISDPALNMGFGGAVRAKGIQDWFDIGLRPSFAITPWFAIVAEGTYQYIDNRAFNAIRAAAGFPNGPGSLAKFTIAPTFHYGPLDSSKIELRIYYTFATWNDNLKGSIVGGDPYRNDNMGHIIGTQAVLNF